MQTLTSTTDTENSMRVGLPQRVPQDCFQSLVPDYALLFFDHLYSEYLTLRSRINEQQQLDLLDAIHERRLKCQLTWSDIYTFDLALIEERPLENLIRKAYDARAKYRSISGQKEFDEYLASKPPDLTSILIAPTQPPKPAEPPEPGQPPQPGEPPEPAQLPQSSDIIQRVLRADIRYLLSKFYLYYAMLPMRESLREDLTSRAVKLTKGILVIIVILIFVSFGGIVVLEKFTRYGDLTGAFGLTVGSVAFAGIVGGCVSMLQRIQSAPSEGDALFNLASLTNGWRGLSLSPLYGGIFASLLFVLFAAGILEGSIFPKINTPGKISPAAQAATSPAVSEPGPKDQKVPSGASAAVPTPAQSAPASAPAQSAPASAPAQSAAAPTATQSAAPATPEKVDTPTPTPPTETEKTGILQIKDFLKETGPKDGVSFALLIIWSFIAGFAERLVPDTLNRLVAKNEAIQGK